MRLSNPASLIVIMPLLGLVSRMGKQASNGDMERRRKARARLAYTAPHPRSPVIVDWLRICVYVCMYKTGTILTYG